MKYIFAAVLLIFVSQALAELPVQGRTDALKKKAQKDDDNKELIFKTEIPFKQDFNVPVKVDSGRACEVDISSDYSQLDDKVSVEAIINTDQCGPSSGKYVVRVRTRNEEGEARTQKYPENWSREDSLPINVKHTYSMGGDSDLVNVRVQMPLDGACNCRSGE